MKKNYETSDLGLATALVVAGNKLVGVDKTQPRRASFIFTQSDGIAGDAEDYWNDNLQVSALAYFDALKRLKTRLYA